jgi:hypothetical protein
MVFEINALMWRWRNLGAAAVQGKGRQGGRRKEEGWEEEAEEAEATSAAAAASSIPNKSQKQEFGTLFGLTMNHTKYLL